MASDYLCTAKQNTRVQWQPEHINRLPLHFCYQLTSLNAIQHGGLAVHVAWAAAQAMSVGAPCSLVLVVTEDVEEVEGSRRQNMIIPPYKHGR